MTTIHERTSCRLCGNGLKHVFSLSPSPVANSFPDKPDKNARRYPLDLMQCYHCSNVQLRHVIGGLFEDYKYTTPKTVARYLEPSAKKLRERFPNAYFVLEIGSNNGTFMQVLANQGFEVTGVDPAASGPRHDNMKAYFSKEWAEKTFDWKKFDLIVANNVLAHIDALDDVFHGMKYLLAHNGAIVFEVQYLPDLVAKGAFDMIYHEHMNYHMLAPLSVFLWSHDLVMTDWEHIPTHGGSIRVTAQRTGTQAQLPFEKIDWDAFKVRVKVLGNIAREKAELNRPLVAFGAAAKACTLINEFQLADKIEFCVDDTPQKQYRYIPGTDIQILPVEKLNGQNLLLTAWNYEKEIRERLPKSKLVNPFA